ncbi:MAG: diguanylate cyclase [Bacillota bacterium]
MAKEYISIEQKFNHIVSEYLHLVKGVEVYIRMNDNLKNNEVYTLLSLIINDKQEKIKNIAILKDTTIKWNYPIEPNKQSIGVDLTKIEGQSDDILYVKNNLSKILVGPINLVQGGKGFIIRTPIMKDSKYWGMTSIVLKTDSIFKSLNEFEKNNEVDLLIMHKDKSRGVIYGNENLLSKEPLLYKNSEEIKLWDIYLVPKKGWINFELYFILFSILAFIISVLISIKLKNYLVRYQEIKEENREIIEKSAKDNFTGIYNKSYFDLKVYEEMQKADRENTNLSMIYFDLDNFKNINDKFGHARGDQVLLKTTEKVKKCLRGYDVFTRWGGDEFAILLPNTNHKNAIIVAKKIKEEINNIILEEGYSLSASLGIAQRKRLEFFESWFRRADNALYKAKNNGRDQFCYLSADDEVKLKIYWDHNWDCKKSTIDKEHLEIVKISNKLVKSSFNKLKYDETIRLADVLFKAVKIHFENEIDYLEKIKYPYVKRHSLIHKNLIKKFKKLYNGLTKKEVETDTLLDFLRDVLIMEHLVDQDKNYRDYINK